MIKSLKLDLCRHTNAHPPTHTDPHPHPNPNPHIHTKNTNNAHLALDRTVEFGHRVCRLVVLLVALLLPRGLGRRVQRLLLELLQVVRLGHLRVHSDGLVLW